MDNVVISLITTLISRAIRQAGAVDEVVYPSHVAKLVAKTVGTAVEVCDGELVTTKLAGSTKFKKV